MRPQRPLPPLPPLPPLRSKGSAGARPPAVAVDVRVLRRWQRVRALTGLLLLVWALASFGFVFYARELSGLRLLGTPLPFYMAAQGTMLIYLAIIGTYAFAMKKIDALAHKAKDDHDGQ